LISVNEHHCDFERIGCSREAELWYAGSMLLLLDRGLGGLTAAAVYARTGRKVLVLERNGGFGGAATVYRHGDLTIEASLHEINGLDASDPKLPLLRSLGLGSRSTAYRSQPAAVGRDDL
jgi:monoamine oxidase